MKFFRNISIPLALLFVFSLLESVHAQEVNILDEIILTDSTSNNPFHYLLINNENSKYKNHDAASLFTGVTGFSLDRKGAYASDPVFRSFKYEQLNIQFDGGTTVAPACPNRMDPVTTHITSEEVEKIEVIKGPYSVRFGSSLGGVVNLVTKMPVYNSEKEYYATFQSGYETNGSSIFSNLEAGVVKEKWNFIANGGIKDFGNYKAGNGEEIMSSWSSKDYSLKGAYSISANQTLRANFRQSFGRDILHPGLPMDTKVDNSSVATIDYDYSVKSNLINSFKAKLYFADVEHVMWNKGRPSEMMMGLSTSETFSQTYGGKAELEFNSGDNSRVFAGIDLKNISVQGENELVKGDVTSYKQVWQDSYLNDLGVFAQYNYLWEAKFSVQAGLRADFVNSGTMQPSDDFIAKNPEGVDPDNEINFSAHMSGRFMFSDELSLVTSLGRGVQTASVQKRYVNTLPVGRDTYFYIGNPLLAPETNNQIDISLDGDMNKFKFNVNVFYSVVDNYISSIITKAPQKVTMPNGVVKMLPGEKQFVNIDRANIYGGELYMGYSFTSSFSMDMSMFYTEGYDRDIDEVLPEIAPLEANISAQYNNDKLYLKLNQRLVATQDNYAVSLGETRTPGFGVVDFFAGYQLYNFVRFDLAFTNILDKNYYEHLSRPYKNMSTSSEFFNMGRNIMLSVKFSI